MQPCGSGYFTTLEKLVKDYYAGLVDVDENIGRVIEFLEKSNQLDDTVLLHSSDHGFFLGEWRMYDKRFMHEPSIRVPTMIRYPKEFQAGHTVDEMILNLDIAPRLLELARVPVPSNMQGQSMVNLAKGKADNWRRDWLYEYYEYPASQKVRPHRGVRTERYKLIHYYQSPEEFELYDLQSDPGEKQNLYGQPEHAALTEKLKNRIAEQPDRRYSRGVAERNSGMACHIAQQRTNMLIYINIGVYVRFASLAVLGGVRPFVGVSPWRNGLFIAPVPT